MKRLVSLIIFIAGFCMLAQSNPQEIELPDGTTFLLGKITRKELQTSPYSQWFQNNYEKYMVDKSLVTLFKKELNATEILLFLGTWCGDSKREVPRIFKVLDAAGFPEESLIIVALDKRSEYYKKSPGGEEKGWDISYVPTLILMNHGKEINRIVERPIGSLEEDLMAILSGTTYIPNYGK